MGPVWDDVWGPYTLETSVKDCGGSLEDCVCSRDPDRARVCPLKSEPESESESEPESGLIPRVVGTTRDV